MNDCNKACPFGNGDKTKVGVRWIERTNNRLEELEEMAEEFRLLKKTVTMWSGALLILVPIITITCSRLLGWALS